MFRARLCSHRFATSFSMPCARIPRTLPRMPDMNCHPVRRSVSVGLVLTLIVALMAFVARSASAQQPVADSTVRLTLGDAVRLAARQNAAVEEALARVDAAKARVTQRRA